MLGNKKVLVRPRICVEEPEEQPRSHCAVSSGPVCDGTHHLESISINCRKPAILMIQDSQSRPSGVVEEKQKVWRWGAVQACQPAFHRSSQGTPGDIMEHLLLSSLRALVKPPLAEASLSQAREIGKTICHSCI